MIYNSNWQVPRMDEVMGGTSVTYPLALSTTAKTIIDPTDWPAIGDNFFNRINRKMKIRMFGTLTTDTTPGNFSFRVYWGHGGDAFGTLIMTGTPLAMAAIQSDLSWYLELDVFCTIVGASGALVCTGIAHLNSALLTVPQPILLPTSAPAAVGSLDLTAAGYFPSVQAMRSGSTVETITVVDFDVTFMSSSRYKT